MLADDGSLEEQIVVVYTESLATLFSCGLEFEASHGDTFVVE